MTLPFRPPPYDHPMYQGDDNRPMGRLWKDWYNQLWNLPIGVPRVLTPTTPTRVLVGNALEITVGITIPANVFSPTGNEGDIFWVYNSTGGALTLTQGAGLTLWLSGGASGNRTAAAHGVSMLWFPITTVCIASGAVT